MSRQFESEGFLAELEELLDSARRQGEEERPDLIVRGFRAIGLLINRENPPDRKSILQCVSAGFPLRHIAGFGYYVVPSEVRAFLERMGRQGSG